MRRCSVLAGILSLLGGGGVVLLGLSRSHVRNLSAVIVPVFYP